MQETNPTLRRLGALSGFAEWNRGNALVTMDGLPVVWFHGTDVRKPFNVFCRWEEGGLGFHFGSPATAGSRLDLMSWNDEDEELEGGAIIPVVVRARNPLRMRDHLTWSARNVLGQLEEMGLIDADAADNAYEQGDGGIFAALEAAGHDAVIYANEVEGERGMDSLLVWRAEQIKGLFASALDIQDPRLCPQASTEPGDLEMWRWIDAEIAAGRDAISDCRTSEMVP